MNITNKIFFLFIFSAVVLNATDEKMISVEKIINSNKRIITGISNKFSIDPAVLATIIFTEKYLNSNWLDDELDFVLVKFGINASVGFCQIKINTAIWIEEQLNHPETKYYLSEDITKLISVSRDKTELTDKLASDSINILYAAAFIAMNIKRWKDNGIDINNNIEILGTLYSNGARRPDINIKINTFGKKAKEFYANKYLLKEFK